MTDASTRRRMLAIEEEKLRIQRRQVTFQGLTIGVPLLALALSIFDAGRRLDREARIQFELEAAKAIMQAEGPAAATGRARVYEQMFPGRLPANFADRIDLRPYRNERTGRLEFIKTVAGRGLSPSETAHLWAALFPGDRFPRSPQVEAVLTGAAGHSASAADQ